MRGWGVGDGEVMVWWCSGVMGCSEARWVVWGAGGVPTSRTLYCAYCGINSGSIVRRT